MKTVIIIYKNMNLNEEEKRYLRVNHPNINEYIDSFWNNIKHNWDFIYNKLIIGDRTGFECIKSGIHPSLINVIDIELTYGEINRLPIENVNVIEIYISPLMKKCNVSVMKLFYLKKIDIDNLIVCCYLAYNPQTINNTQIINNEATDSDDFAELNAMIKNVLTSFNIPVVISNHMDSIVYNSMEVQAEDEFGTMNTVLNLVLVFDIAWKPLFKQEEVMFKSDNTIKSRIINYPLINLPIKILLELIGEYNLIHHIGHIEILMNDDPLITPDDEFKKITEINNDIIFIHARCNYTSCVYCNHTNTQLNLFNSGTYTYCSDYCRNIHTEQMENIIFSLK